MAEAAPQPAAAKGGGGGEGTRAGAQRRRAWEKRPWPDSAMPTALRACKAAALRPPFGQAPRRRPRRKAAGRSMRMSSSPLLGLRLGGGWPSGQFDGPRRACRLAYDHMGDRQAHCTTAAQGGWSRLRSRRLAANSPAAGRCGLCILPRSTPSGVQRTPVVHDLPWSQPCFLPACRQRATWRGGLTPDRG